MPKIQGKDPGEFTMIEEGRHLFRVKTAKARKPEKEGQGWLYTVESKLEGGELDGARHFESFFTRSQFGDGLDGCRALLKFLNVTAVMNQEEFDSDKFETEQFAQKFEKSVMDRTYGAEIKHKKDKDGKEWPRTVKYLAPSDLKGGGGSKTPAPPKQDDEW